MVYFVCEPFEAVLRPDASTLGYVTVMPGSTVTVLGEAEQSGIVKISYMDRIATASMRDIRAKAKLVDDKTAGYTTSEARLLKFHVGCDKTDHPPPPRPHPPPRLPHT
jgi:ethanolamine utilization microcompartment shell protein EutS